MLDECGRYAEIISCFATLVWVDEEVVVSDQVCLDADSVAKAHRHVFLLVSVNGEIPTNMRRRQNPPVAHDCTVRSCGQIVPSRTAVEKSFEKELN